MVDTIPYRLIEQTAKSDTLVIMFPGAGYTTQAPLLHFTTGVFYKKGFDILHVNYRFSSQELAALSEEDFAKNVKTVIDHILQDKHYDHFYLVGKSIGTIALTTTLKSSLFAKAKVIWLTPLLQRDDVFQTMQTSKNEGLCIIGDHDRCFIEERMKKVEMNSDLKTKIIEGADHSLELNQNPLESITILKEIISEIDSF
ncbi:alpha/beta family hydrolase [Anaerobacillus sp. CMMVII]|uniref:alpha/beta family hydrolase n=1 Tax=Anaerobacillus sp. CMMVII TaxID=2755588 RepID=UPI0021B76715|nr:alpha/beta family hydrolase [Anaerobacillus sp. CMMVII]